MGRLRPITVYILNEELGGAKPHLLRATEGSEESDREDSAAAAAEDSRNH